MNNIDLPKKKCNACFYKPTITKKKKTYTLTYTHTLNNKCKISQISFPMFYKRKKMYIYKK